MADLVQGTDINKVKHRVLARSGIHLPRTGADYQVNLAAGEPIPARLLQLALNSQYLAVDVETRGSDYTLAYPEQTEVVGVGFAGEFCSFYVPYPKPQIDPNLYQLLTQHTGFLAHNLYFDGGYLAKLLDTQATTAGPVTYHMCTYAAIAHVANEGYLDNSWSLKSAMTEYLGWPDTNEIDLDLWLCLNGHYKGTKRKDESPEALTASYLAGTLRPKKGEMWQAPPDILGKYCILDAEATYLLYTKVLLPVLEQFPDLEDYLRNQFVPHILKHIEQKHWGILTDTQQLRKVAASTRATISELNKQIREYPEAQAGIQAIESALTLKLRGKEPPRHNKRKPPGQEPPQVTKSGAPSKNWLKWQERTVAYNSPPPVAKAWIKWEKRVAASLEAGEAKFNPNSDDQLRQLLHDHMGFPTEIRTDSGESSTSVKAFAHMGGFGKLLTELAYTEKSAGYLDKYVELTETRPTIHPGFRMPGPCTGRLSGTEPNFQQLPKTREVYSLFQATPGNVLVDLDFASLESVIAADFSQDPGLLLLFNSPGTYNDPYLYLGYYVPGPLGDAIRKSGYNPQGNTKEQLATAKKLAKPERNICKPVYLGCQYGARKHRIMQSLNESGIEISLYEAEQLYTAYWEAFAGLRTFQLQLRDQWLENGGYVLNGIGRPMCIPDELEKDILNRFIQSTGHDVLVMYCNTLAKHLSMQGITWAPYIWDLHDAVTVECREQDAEKVVACFRNAMLELNSMLGTTVQLSGVPMVGKTLADVKEPEV